MYHTLAFKGAVGQTANTALPGLADDIISRNPTTNNFMLPEPMFLYAAAVMGATINRARIVTPTFRQITLPFIRPVITGLLPTDFMTMQLFLDQPLRMAENEEISIEATSDLGAGTEQTSCLLFLGPQLEPIPPGDIMTMRATSVTAAVASAWTTIGYTLADNLPPGRYGLLGSEVVSTTGIAHRWIVPNQFYRPGNLSGATNALRSSFQFQNRQMGLFGQFLNTVMPQLQVLCNAADAAHTIYMQLVRMS